nr:hypothetical protein [Tanacetum cinerariifolium]
MRENIYFYSIHTYILFILSYVILLFNTTTATSHGHPLVAATGQAVHKCIDKERQALLDFKAPLHDPSGMLSTWRPDDDDCCQWFGVTCNNQTGHVTELQLDGFAYNSSLEGEITLSLLNLTYLSRLDLLYNSFHGTFPKFICSMTHLTFLGLSNNKFSGTIPESIANMTQLTYLDLFENSFNGVIHVSIGNITQLTYLDLTANMFSGVIPESIGSLTKLTQLSLNGNNFNGTIPISIGSLTSLTYLDLSANKFSGTIPREFGNLTNLEYLNLYSLGSCRVENLDWLSSLSSLEELEMDGTSLAKANNWVNVIIGLQNLHYLSLVGCDLSHVMHPYSSSVNSSSSIHYLFLQKNNLNLPMYSWLCPLFGKKLEYLFISGNKFDGNLSDFLNTLSTSATTLESLDASSNQFTGSLSDEIQNFSFLKSLNLSLNQLNGTISDKLWQLPNLRALDISFNNISGKLPKSLSNHDLDYIDLSFNCFYGPIPAFPADLSFNNLHGTIPPCVNNLTSMVQKGTFLEQNKRHYFHFIANSYIDHLLIEWQGKVNEFSSILGLLKAIDLSSNNLTGKIPNEVTNLHGLLVLDLSNNSLVGGIPRNIGHMTELLTLNLSRNMFSGEMPSSMSDMHSLNDLDVSFNNLSGRVPSSTQLQSFEPTRFTGNAGLCGLPTTKKCPKDEYLGVPHDVNSGSDGYSTDELQRWFYVGGATGFATGFWIVCSVLLLNRQGSQFWAGITGSRPDIAGSIRVLAGISGSISVLAGISGSIRSWPDIAGSWPDIARSFPDIAGSNQLVMEGVDRLNELKDMLVNNIMSRLDCTTKELIRTTATISKRWKNLWTQLPHLNFSYEDGGIDYYTVKEDIHRYISFINNTLNQCLTDLNIKKFKLDIRANRWIRYAISRNVEEVDLRLWDVVVGPFSDDDDELFFESYSYGMYQ